MLAVKTDAGFAHRHMFGLLEHFVLKSLPRNRRRRALLAVKRLFQALCAVVYSRSVAFSSAVHP